METVKQWMICIIVCSLIGTLTTVLMPKGSTQRAMKVVISVFLVSAFLSPFLGGERIDFQEKLPEFSFHKESLVSEITEIMMKEAEKQTVIKTKELLADLSVEYVSVEAQASVDNEENIFIENIKIILDYKYRYRQKQITSNLKTMFSSEVEYEWVKE